MILQAQINSSNPSNPHYDTKAKATQAIAEPTPTEGVAAMTIPMIARTLKKKKNADKWRLLHFKEQSKSKQAIAAAAKKAALEATN